jgi:L,D-transpeptidase catalytic domain
LGAQLNGNNAWRRSEAPRRQRTGGALPGHFGTLGLATALSVALGCAPAAARSQLRHKSEPKAEHVSKEPFGNIPKGPLQIFVSIDQQKLHLYSDGAHVADTSVATGVPSLPTPLGVFDVIQKQVFHRSNIYSNAPMPYMQRITWSGVALHEGENIGHRASHGCIRMPHDFAVRLYSLTRLGARVIVSNGELKPAEFADSHLFVHKDKAPDQVAAAPAPVAPVKTAESIDANQAADTTLADAKSVDIKSADAAPAAAASVQPAASIDTNKTVDAAPADGKPVSSKSADGGSGDAAASLRPSEIGLRVSNDGAAGAPIPVTAAKSDGPAATDVKTPVATPPVQKTEAPAPDVNVPMPAAKPAEFAKDAPAKTTPISIFISRKEKKIYVRQNFEPVFAAVVTIAQPNEPLGTHVFTAMNLLDDHTTFRWTVVSLPGKPVRRSEDAKQFEKHARGRHRDDDSERSAGEPPPPQTPQQALARIDIPQNAIDYISELMVPGSSLVVSDQGLGDETGEGTDFVVTQ